MQYQNIWIRDLEDGVMTFVMTLDINLIKTTIISMKEQIETTITP